jgi:hypothetical protein
MGLLEEEKWEKLARNHPETLHIPTQDELQLSMNELKNLNDEENQISRIIDILDSE